jgi:uncharacterized protein
MERLRERAMPDPICVYCRKRPRDPRWDPFCSERCKMADLGRWLSDDYRVSTKSPATEDEPEGEHE